MDRRLDDLRHPREGLGLPPGPALDDPPDRRRPIRDLRDVEVNFDGITYAKGASVLKQLVAYVGREPFRDGLRAYFAKHAWGNTTLDDLLVELEATSGRDLRAWSRLWLETAGVNTLRPVLEVDDRGLITSAP
jgi:aminopeptidase N